MRSNRKPITADELADLQQAQRDGERERLQRIERNRIEEQPIVSDLKELGVHVERVWELTKQRADWVRALPVLLRHLEADYSTDTKSTLVRLLSVPHVKGVAAKPLIREYEKATDETSLKWTIGNALSVVADDTVFDDIVRLAKDKRNGKAREMVVVALGNMRNPQAVDVLMELLDDSVVAGHAIMALRKLKATKAKEKVLPFQQHPVRWIREEAKKAIKKW